MKRWLLIGILLLVPFFGTSQSAEKACFSVPGGFYEESFSLEIFPFYPQHHIRFTTNGNRPTAASRLYTEPLLLDGSLYSTSDIYTIQITPDDQVFVPDSIKHCIVIRAAVFDENDSCISAVTTNSYFVQALGCDTHGLPAVSICADSLDLFGEEQGIMIPGPSYDPNYPHTTGNFNMHGIEWERLINVEYYDSRDNSGINQTCGMRTHGNRARRMPQKGLKIYAREEYGTKRFVHRFFDDTPHNSFKHLILKPFSTLWPFAGIQDYICNYLAIGLGLESGNSRPVVLYLNGEYWGIYFLQEKMDERYLEDHFGINIEHCNIISNWWELECGQDGPFLEMMQWLDTADLTTKVGYSRINELIDMDNFIDYVVFETFIANYDWPANNNRCWQSEGGKWRWMFFDGDATFNDYGMDPFGQATELDVFGNATYTGPYTWPSSAKATLLFRKLLENQTFRNQFDQRIYTLCQSDFLYDNTSVWYLRITDLLRNEIPNQADRFANPNGVSFWDYACSLTDNFLQTRVDTYLDEWHAFMTDLPEYTDAFLCYPNPFTNELRICLPTGATAVDEIRIFDLLGREMFSQPCSVDELQKEVTVYPRLTPGVYFLKMGNRVTKIVRR